jgi:hypothetical protein
MRLASLRSAQLAQMLMMLSIACLGPGLWHVPVEHSVFDAFGGFLQLRHLVLFPMAAVTMLLAVQSVLRVVVGGRTLTKKADAGAKDLGLVDKLMQVSERAKRASLLKDEHTRDEVREMATGIMATPERC